MLVEERLIPFMLRTESVTLELTITKEKFHPSEFILLRLLQQGTNPGKSEIFCADF